ncbi:MAG TPA: GDSL-type esterase/lipase family protein, partial [Chthoniobacterales bacterium]|nr:GDSL-type esterase/lipase family protein [Chthoniobacterales bacterium]
MIATASVQSAAAARRDPSGVRTILCLGNSLTDGYGLARSQAYPALLAEKIRAEGLGKFEIINAGVSGDTTAGGLRRISRYLDRKIDVFIL